MKQKIIAILLTIALLAGCNIPTSAALSAEEPNIAQYRDGEAIIEYILAPGTRAVVEKALDIPGGRAADCSLTNDPFSATTSKVYFVYL